MILIVEGSDLVGKSTIADAIGTRHGWPVVKIRWALQGDPEVETRAMAKSTIAILDATHPDVFSIGFISRGGLMAPSSAMTSATCPS